MNNQPFDVSPPVLMTIKTPCDVGWETMSGNQEVRFCNQCQKNVYNLLGKSDKEVAAIIRHTGKEFCGRLYQRPDGSFTTGACPKSTVSTRSRFQFSLASLLVLVLISAGFCKSLPWIGQKVALIIDQLTPNPNPAPQGWTAMPGAICVEGEIELIDGSGEDTSDLLAE